MKNGKLGGISLLILILVSMTSILITTTFMTIPVANAYVTNKAPLVSDGYFYSCASLLVDDGNEDSIVATYSNVAFSLSVNLPDPVHWYNTPPSGEYPPAVAAKTVDNGRVMAIGGGGGSVAYTRFIDMNNMDSFLNWLNWLDNRFHHKTILWYEGHEMYYKASDPTYLSYNWVENLKALGWIVSFTSTDPITSSIFGDNDIFWLNTIEFGYPFVASEITAISAYVRSGGSLLLGGQSDYGPIGTNYEMTENMNWVLDNLQCGFRFNDDELCDNTNNYSSTNFNPRVYLTNHEANGIPPYGVSITSDPNYRDGLPGGSVTYKLTLTNMGTNDDSENLTVINDNASWTTSFSLNPVPIKAGQDNYATLTVNIPADAPYRYQDNITVVATPQGDNTKKDNVKVTAYSATWIQPPEEDTQCVENGAGGPGRIWGGQPQLYAGSSTTGYKNERSYLKFDLRQGVPAGYTITSAWLYLYCFTVRGAAGKNVELREESDSWSEENATWDNLPPAPGSVISTFSVTQEDRWYGVDVTTYVNSQRSLDNIVSFCLKAQTEGLSSPDNFSYGFDSKEYTYLDDHPFIVFGVRPVASYIKAGSGYPGKNVTVQAVINNRGAVMDNYTVTVENTTENWVVNPMSKVLDNVPQGENRTVNITVTIPDNAVAGTWENLKMTITSKKDNGYTHVNTDNGVWVGYSFNVLAGWNIIGFLPPENTPNNIFTGLTYYDNYCIYYFKPPAAYKIQNPTYVLSDNTGYWVWIDRDKTLRTNGLPPTSRTITLVAGWNLVHFPVTNENTYPNKIFTGLTYYDNYCLYYFKPPAAYKIQNPTQVLSDNTGYWVWIDQAKTVTVPNG